METANILIDEEREIVFNFPHFSVIFNIEDNDWYIEDQTEEGEEIRELDVENIKRGNSVTIHGKEIDKEMIRKLEILVKEYRQ